MTPRERADRVVGELWPDWFKVTTAVIADAIERTITAATDEAYERAAKAAMATMERLNTNYRHEIADAIRALRGQP